MKTNKIIYGCLLWLSISACGGTSDIKSADQAYERLEYAYALDLYKSLFEKAKAEEQKAQASLGVARSAYQIGRYKESAEWYKKAARLNNTAEVKLEMARSMQGMGQYEQALKLLRGMPASAAVNQLIKGCELALQQQNIPSRYEVNPLNGINTAHAEYAPALGADGAFLFTSDRPNGEEVFKATNRSFSNILQANLTQLDQKSVKSAALSGNVNTTMNEGNAFWDARSGMLFYTQCNGEEGKQLTCKILMAGNEGGKWLVKDSLPFNSELYSIAHPCLSADGQVLYFSSDMPGGLGGKDLYQVKRDPATGTWSEPMNLVGINTPGNEVFPQVVVRKGVTELYFASDGYAGYGGLDILLSRESNANWSAPQPLQAPVNSGADDFGLIWESNFESGYFTSNRAGGKGGDDIYQVKLLPPQINVRGVVYDENSGEVVRNANISYRIPGRPEQILRTDEKGAYLIEKVPSEQQVQLRASKPEDYFLDSEMEQLSTLGIDSSITLVQDFRLKSLDLNAEFTLEGIYYELNKAEITPASAKILDSLALLLNKYPKVQIELGSHTDCRSDSVYNASLSQKRAQAAVDYLKQKGIAAERMLAKGYGESVPVNDCRCEGNQVNRECTEQEHKMNRRTTFKILSTGFNKSGK